VEENDMSTPDEPRRNSESSGTGEREKSVNAPRDEGYVSSTTRQASKTALLPTERRLVELLMILALLWKEYIRNFLSSTNSGQDHV